MKSGHGNGERDRSLDRLLRRRVDPRSDDRATDACLDAEIVAAWMENSLSRDERAAAEQHAAGCARCQVLLASVARTAPQAPPRAWWRPLATPWLIPFAAAAIALTLWVSVDREREHVALLPETAAKSARAQAPEPQAQPAAGASAQSAAARDKDAATLARAPKQTGDAKTRAKEKSLIDLARRTEGGVAGGQSIDALRQLERPRADETASTVVPERPAVPSPSAAPAAPLPPAASAAAKASAVPVPGKPASAGLAETLAVAAETPRLAGAAGGRIAGRTANSVARRVVDVVSPEPAFRWRISGTSIERSTDGGVTWMPQPGPPTVLGLRSGTASTLPAVTLTAGSSPSRNVCWLVGDGGAIALTTDGATWRRLPFPDAVTLTAVRAIDDKSAVVTTADGRQFSTADGGATWSTIPK